MSDLPTDEGTTRAIAALRAQREAAARATLAARRKVEPVDAAPAAAPEPEAPKADAGASAGGRRPRRPTRPADEDVLVHPWPDDCPVTPVGHNDGVFYFLDAAGQFVGLPREKMVHAQLRGLFLSHIEYLYETWPRWKLFDTGWRIVGWRPEQVAESAIVACDAKGVIDPADLVRGPGAWLGRGGELIMHCGDVVLVGPRPADEADADAPWAEHKPGLIDGHIYPRAPRLPRPHPERVSADEVRDTKLVDLLNSWQFVRGDLDALLLLGWIGAAMVGGALQWRPVTWITGGAGTGKSTMWRLVQLLVGELLAFSDTTAANLWQTLQLSTRAIAVDELENEADNRKQQNVVKLARQAASGGKIGRGGQDHRPVEFNARSCFAFLSIIVPPLPTQDRSRMAILELRKLPEGASTPALDPDRFALIGAKIRRRLFDHWHRLGGVIESYRCALKEQKHEQRGQDVFGTLLGIADVLLWDLDVGDREATPAHQAGGFDVHALVKRLNAATLAETADAFTNERAMLNHLLSQVVDPWRNGTRCALFEYVLQVASDKQPDLALEEKERVSAEQTAARALSLHGLLVTDGAGKTRGGHARTHLAVAYQHPELLRLFGGTTWAGLPDAVGPWVQAARRIAGAANSPNALWFAGGSARAVLVPLSAVLSDDAPAPAPAPRPSGGEHDDPREAVS